MNCKPGDLAIVVKSKVGNEGKIVRCIRLATAEEADRIEYWFGALWHIDAEIMSQRRNGFDRRKVPFCPDECLRPIRPQSHDARDETLTWLDVPTKQGETA